MCVGIDVAKAELVVSLLPSGERFTVANDDRGVRTLVERVRAVVGQFAQRTISCNWLLPSILASARRDSCS